MQLIALTDESVTAWAQWRVRRLRQRAGINKLYSKEGLTILKTISSSMKHITSQLII